MLKPGAPTDWDQIQKTSASSHHTEHRQKFQDSQQTLKFSWIRKIKANSGKHVPFSRGEFECFKDPNTEIHLSADVAKTVAMRGATYGLIKKIVHSFWKMGMIYEHEKAAVTWAVSTRSSQNPLLKLWSPLIWAETGTDTTTGQSTAQQDKQQIPPKKGHAVYRFIKRQVKIMARMHKWLAKMSKVQAKHPKIVLRC